MINLVALAMLVPSATLLTPDSKVELLTTGYAFTEGPIWTKSNTLIFSDIPGNKMYEWKNGKATVYRDPSNNANGNQIDPLGRLITCHHGSRNVTRTEADGKVTVLADSIDGKRLNSPNDLVAAKDGTIFFTDPPWGIPASAQELDYFGIFKIDVKGATSVVYKSKTRVNGIALSPNGKTLYVSDDTLKLQKFAVLKDGKLGEPKFFGDMKLDRPGWADGMRVDVLGNIWVTAPGGIQVWSPAGERLTEIALPEMGTNLAWGDRDAKTLYITAGKSVYRLRTNVKGLRH